MRRFDYPVSSKVDFSQRSKLFVEADRCTEKFKMDLDEFVRKLKSLDLEQKDPLPLHIMYGYLGGLVL